MLKQIKYFQTVVRCNSFSEAAEECYISQSAISQQVQALERELGVKLPKRENRRFSLTPVGEHFYQKSLLIMADFERLCKETKHIAQGNDFTLRIGYIKGYGGAEFQRAVAEFTAKYPDEIKISKHLLQSMNLTDREEIFTRICLQNVPQAVREQPTRLQMWRSFL